MDMCLNLVTVDRTGHTKHIRSRSLARAGACGRRVCGHARARANVPVRGVGIGTGISIGTGTGIGIIGIAHLGIGNGGGRRMLLWAAADAAAGDGG